MRKPKPKTHRDETVKDIYVTVNSATEDAFQNDNITAVTTPQELAPGVGAFRVLAHYKLVGYVTVSSVVTVEDGAKSKSKR